MRESNARATRRRAGTARLLACFGAFLVSQVVLLPVAEALANPPAPILTGTDPESPGLSLTPSVHGSSNGIIISSFPGPRTGAIAFVGGSESTVSLYPTKNCEGAPFATGSANDLDTTGIQVTVVAETTTWISANLEDQFESVSGCSNAISYQQVKELPKKEESSGGGPGNPGGGNGGSTAPPAAPRLHMVPGAVANDTTPLVAGSAPGAISVKLFASPNCAGSPFAKVSPGQLAAGVGVSVTPNDVVLFSAVSVNGAGASACSAPVSYAEDSTAPRTRITMGPASKTRRRVAVFRFVDTTGAVPGTKYFCRVNKHKWAPCTSPLKIRHLHPRRYLFQVKAVDEVGNQDAKPAARRFKVVRP